MVLETFKAEGNFGRYNEAMAECAAQRVLEKSQSTRSSGSTHPHSEKGTNVDIHLSHPRFEVVTACVVTNACVHDCNAREDFYSTKLVALGLLSTMAFHKLKELMYNRLVYSVPYSTLRRSRIFAGSLLTEAEI